MEHMPNKPSHHILNSKLSSTITSKIEFLNKPWSLNINIDLIRVKMTYYHKVTYLSTNFEDLLTHKFQQTAFITFGSILGNEEANCDAR